MSELPETRDTLLARLKDRADREAWEQFAALYGPPIYRIARSRGLQDFDAHDLTQQVLMSVAKSIPSWQRSDANTGFRHWLRRVIRNAAINALSRRPVDRASGGSAWVDIAGPADRCHAIGEQIEWEYRREVYRRAASEVRESVESQTWELFERTAVDGEPIAAVAAATGASVGSVYVARSRVMRRLQQVVQRIEQEYQ